MRSLGVFLYLIGGIQAAPITNSTASAITACNSEALPTSLTTRTIWSIISSSVLTLFACIYSAIHPNIPSPKDSPFRILRRRLGIMIMALIAPELIVTWAMRQWLSARQVTRQFEKSGYFSVNPESGYHGSIEATTEQYVEGELHILSCHTSNTFPYDLPASQDYDSTRLLVAHPKGDSSSARIYAAVHTSTPVPASRHEGTWHIVARPFKKLLRSYVSEQSEDYMWTQGHSFFVLMGGFTLYVDGKPYHTLQPDEVLKLIRAGCIDAPSLTENQICDKSKGTVISKGLVLLQVVWFVMQLITRVIYGLEITQLEIGTLAFAVLNFLTYAVWWNKPLDVRCPYPVYWKSTESRPEEHIYDVPAMDTPAQYGIFSPVLGPIGEVTGLSDIPASRKLRVPTFDGSVTLEDSNRRVLQLAALLMATIFGGIHCMAWTFTFPSGQEQVLWQISAVAITFTPWFYFLPKFIPNNSLLGVVESALIGLIYLISVPLYITARALLLVLMFTTLRDLHPGAYYAVQWTIWVPHL
ncbi:hypothetical protein BDR04DRAFT_1162504 [Suillus decipiens]|nr:hypothetical protein BDR04DRAFT_1162504 [Suillus decipiens]